MLAAAYGVVPDQAEELVDVIDGEHQHQIQHIRDEAVAGNEPWATFWRETDGERCAAADNIWLRKQRSRAIAAIAGA